MKTTAIEARLNDPGRKCRHCGVPVGEISKRCWHCQVDLDAAESDPAPKAITAHRFADAAVGVSHSALVGLFEAAMAEGRRQARHA